MSGENEMAAKWHGMNWLRQEKRLAIYMRDGFACVYCRRDLRGGEPRALTLDHLTPRSEGGNNEASNLVTACDSCNSARGAMPLDRWLGEAVNEHLGRALETAIRTYAAETPINVKLAKAILAGEVGDPRLEAQDLEQGENS